MSGRSISFSSLALTSCLIMFASPSMAQYRPLPRRSVVIPLSQAGAISEVRELYVAIMGQVARPGTYHLDPSKLTLRTVVDLAGGLTPDPMTSIRVIRSGRENQQISYSESVAQSDLPIQPGDLLIVEKKKATTGVGQVVEFDRDPTTVRASYEQQAEPAGVQIALVNVLDYPIVFTFPAEEATPQQIVHSLGQRPELLSAYKIVGASYRNRGFEPIPPTIQLTAGSALVFDRSAINRERLPKTLPKPIESDIEFGAQAGLIGSPQGQSEQLLNVGRQAALPSNEALEQLPPVPPAAVERTPLEQPIEPELELPTVSTSKPRIAIVPFSGDAPITKSSTAARSKSDMFEPAPKKAEPTFTVEPGIESLNSVVDEPAIPQDSKMSAMTLVIMIGMISVAFVGAVILIRQRAKSQIAFGPIEPSFPSNSIETIPESASIAPVISRPAPMTLLERMIKNQIPLTTEPVEFPSELVLQGKIVAKPILRVDGAQDVIVQSGPHFMTPDQRSSDSAIQDVIAQAEGPESMPRRPHFIRTQKAPDLASAPSGQGPQASGGRSNAPLASALFELERGGHS